MNPHTLSSTGGQRVDNIGFKTAGLEDGTAVVRNRDSMRCDGQAYNSQNGHENRKHSIH